MSAVNKKLIDKYWTEVSDLTIFEAAYWTQIGDDPRAHNYSRDGGDNEYLEYFEDHPGGKEAVEEQCHVIASATRTGEISITEENDPGKKKRDFRHTLIRKSDWLGWCHKNGYVELVVRFIQTTTHTKVEASQTTNQSSDDWKEIARAIADECFDHDTNLKTRDSLTNYSKRVMDIMQEREIHGPQGRYDNPNTVKREALQGAKWWAKKLK